MFLGMFRSDDCENWPKICHCFAVYNLRKNKHHSGDLSSTCLFAYELSLYYITNLLHESVEKWNEMKKNTCWLVIIVHPPLILKKMAYPPALSFLKGQSPPHTQWWGKPDKKISSQYSQSFTLALKVHFLKAPIVKMIMKTIVLLIPDNPLQEEPFRFIHIGKASQRDHQHTSQPWPTSEIITLGPLRIL